jgi:hypothetical protein
MLATYIIYPIKKLEWDSPMVIQPKKHEPKRLRICVEFKGLNKITIIDPFPTLFVDEIINEVASHKCYWFIDVFWVYNQDLIAKEDRENTTFVTKFGSFAYRVVTFGLKIAPIIFSNIVVKAFQKFIYKTMVVYFVDWNIYSLLKIQIHWLKMILERCRKIKLSLNIRKCIFTTPIGMELGHIVCKDGIKFYMPKMKFMLYLNPTMNLKHVQIFLGQFIRHHSNIIFPMDELLKNVVEFIYSAYCNDSFRKTKEKVSRSSNPYISQLDQEVSHACRCIQCSSKVWLIIPWERRHRPPYLQC